MSTEQWPFDSARHDLFELEQRKHLAQVTIADGVLAQLGLAQPFEQDPEGKRSVKITPEPEPERLQIMSHLRRAGLLRTQGEGDLPDALHSRTCFTQA